MRRLDIKYILFCVLLIGVFVTACGKKEDVVNKKKEDVQITLENTFEIGKNDADTFEIPFGEQDGLVEDSELIGADVDGTSFRLEQCKYENGALILDTGTLSELGQHSISATFEAKDKSRIHVTANIDVYTMVIDNEEELNKMPSVIAANNGAGHYILGDDIVCLVKYNGSNKDPEPKYTFTGTFDGRGHVIENLTIAGERFWTNRGLLGHTLDKTGVVKNVAILDASHYGRGGLIVTDCKGTIENVYIEVEMGTPYASGERWSASMTSMASYIKDGSKIKNVLIEYKVPLAENARDGYAVWNLSSAHTYEGLYVIGAGKVAQEAYPEKINLTTGTGYGAYNSLDEFIDAGLDLSAWDETDFWKVVDGYPYPTQLRE